MIDYATFQRIQHLLRVEQLTVAQIALAMAMDARTVRRWLDEPQFRARATPARPSKLDPYKAYIRQLLEHHPYSAAQLLTRGQRAAVDAIARAPDWLVGVQGHAGAGKTTMLRAAAELPGMPRVHGLAPSSAAVRALSRGAGIEARTLQWFHTRFDDLSDPERIARGREMYAGTVLAVDEASMIGTVQMEALLRIAGKLEVARVVLLGEPSRRAQELVDGAGGGEFVEPAEGSDDGLLDALSFAAILRDLEILIRADFLDADEHGVSPSLTPHILGEL